MKRGHWPPPEPEYGIWHQLRWDAILKKCNYPESPTRSIVHPNFLIHSDVANNVLKAVQWVLHVSDPCKDSPCVVVRIVSKLNFWWIFKQIDGVTKLDSSAALSERRWLVFFMQTQPLTPASRFLHEAPFPPPNPPVDCDAMLWIHFLLEDMPSMKRKVNMFYRYYSLSLWLYLSFSLRTKKHLIWNAIYIFSFCPKIK